MYMEWVKTSETLPAEREIILFHSATENCELLGVYIKKSNKFISSSKRYHAVVCPYWAKVTDPTEQDRLPALFGFNDLIRHERKRCEHKDSQINFLWKLLDDISTAGDIYKPEGDGYFKMVEMLCNSRCKVANSYDGLPLTIKEYFE